MGAGWYEDAKQASNNIERALALQGDDPTTLTSGPSTRDSVAVWGPPVEEEMRTRIPTGICHNGQPRSPLVSGRCRASAGEPRPAQVGRGSANRRPRNPWGLEKADSSMRTLAVARVTALEAR
jgi:hypothetical protein